MRHLAFISALAILVAGCGAADPSASVPESSPVRTALPTPATTPEATPAATPSPAPTTAPSPKIVAGWPKVSRGGVTMTGRDLWEEMGSINAPVIRVKMTGLAPGEVVSLSGTGTYDSELRCGPLPSRCGGEVNYEVQAGKDACVPSYEKQATGRFSISEQTTADASGTAVAKLRFVIPETRDACPVDGPGRVGWFPYGGEWKVRVTDAAHGLRLKPDEYAWGP